MVTAKLKLELPQKAVKKQKGFYLEEETIDFIKDESDRLDVSENVLLTAIVNFYRQQVS